MAREPVRQRLGAGAFGVRQAARPECAHEQLCLEGFLTVRPVDRYRAPGVIDEELLPGKVPLAHRALQPFLTAPVDLAKGAAPVGLRAVTLAVLLPQQLQRHVPVAL